MPLYEYQCEQCSHQFEQIRKFSDPPLVECPKCGGKLRKLMSSPAIQFKGTGWYITDYAKKDQVPATKSGESKSGDGNTAAESKSDAKSDTKTEAKTETKSESKTETKSST